MSYIYTESTKTNEQLDMVTTATTSSSPFHSLTVWYTVKSGVLPSDNGH